MPKPSAEAAAAAATKVWSPAELFDLTGQVAIVTGASSGLGERFSRVLTAAGASVVLAGRRAERLRRVAADLPGALAVECDVTRDEDCQRLVDTVLTRHQQIDILVNNAGASQPARALDESADQFQRILQVNLVGVYRLCHLIGAHMVARGAGSIVNVASMFGLVGSGRMPQASYAASKAAVINLTRELAAQWARSGVRVNALAPGFFETEMTHDLFARPEGAQWVGRLTPMGRGGQPGELDGALLFLTSRASSYATGSVLVVDGGWTAI
jgi:hypothetical protein